MIIYGGSQVTTLYLMSYGEYCNQGTTINPINYVIYLRFSFLEEGLMYHLNKLFVKQVKSLRLLLD